MKDTTENSDRKSILDEARHRMAETLSLNNITAWTFDITSKIITFLDKGDVNDRLRKDFEETIHPDDLKAALLFIDEMSKGIRKENSHTIRIRQDKDSDYRYYESKSKVIFDEEGIPKTIVGTYRDITEEYIRNEKLEDTKKVLDNILNKSSIMIWDYEFSTKRTRIYNDSIFGKKSSYNQEEHNSLNDISKEDLDKLINAYRKLAAGEIENEELIFEIKSLDGSPRTARCNLSYRRNDINIITHIVGCVIDITSQREKEREEREKNAMVNLIMRTEESNAWYISFKEQIFHIVSGIDYIGADGKNMDEVTALMTPKSSKDSYELFRKLANQEIQSSSIIVEFINPNDNSISYNRNAFVAVYNDKKEMTGVIGFQKDITKEEIKKRNLKKYQINSDIVNRVARIIYWEYDLSTNLISTRGSMHNEGLPMTKEQFISYIHPNDRNLISECIQSMDRRMDIIEPFEARCHLPQYEGYRWVKFYISPVRSNDKIVSYTGIRHDTNDERLNSMNLERLNAQINQVMIMSEIIPFIWNPKSDAFFFTSDNMIKENNEIFNAPKVVSTFDKVLSAIHPDDRKTILSMYNKITSGKEDRGWCKLRYDENHKFERTYIVSILPDETSNEERTFIGYLQDITNHELLTKRLVDEKLKAEEGERLKSNFLANMSHEIRTPLNAIVGFSTLLAEAESKDETSEYTNIIQKNSEVLLQLINDIIEISRIDAGRTKRYPTMFSMTELFKENFTMEKELIKIPNVEIRLDIPDEVVVVNADRRRMTELLNNFMSNAAKYTTSGYIKMGFRIMDKDRIRLFVEDTGCGIAEENKQKIFGRFEKLNSFVQGAGLGMSICQHYVKEAGGNIWVESELGKGSTFFVEFKYN